jgi:hypothetical protein
MPTRPKTGDKRKTRQPLKIDKLPAELRDRIQMERSLGLTWEEIEEISPSFKEWEKVSDAGMKLFPGKRIPKSSLQRWWDLRVDQVKAELMARAEKAREIAAAFAGSKFEELPAAVEGALRDQIFSLMQASDMSSRAKVITELQKLGLLLAQKRKLELQEMKQQTDERALQIKIEVMRAKVAALKKDVDGGGGKKKQMSPDELKKRVDEIYGLSAA